MKCAEMAHHGEVNFGRNQKSFLFSINPFFEILSLSIPGKDKIREKFQI
jgi:hypothetical protein